MADDWDSAVRASDTSTFLHTRRFLSYHGDRFADASVAFAGDDGGLVAVLPAAVHPDDPSVVVSHPGATFGGLVTTAPRSGREHIEAACAHWRDAGFSRLVYKPVPAVYHRSPFADDVYALWRLGARRTCADLASVIDLERPEAVASRRRRAVSKARNAGVEVLAGADQLERLWPVVEEVLRVRHGVAPVHALADIADLAARFPEEIEVRVAALGGEAIAGTVLFVSERLVHTQYLAAGEDGRAVGALDLVVAHAIDEARAAGRRWFDFGTSAAANGTVNEGLHSQKQEFGAGTVLYERYELDL